MQSTPPAWNQNQGDDQGAPPAWRNTLKTTGVKPWDSDLDYTAPQQQAPRSASFTPVAAPAYSPNQAAEGGEGEDGPKVVHLQYNSPMGLYSNENVQETYKGQTQAMAVGGPTS